MHKIGRTGNELRNLIAWAKELGFSCEKTGGKHIIFRRPGTRAVYSSTTPSDHRAYENTKGKLKRAVRDADSGVERSGWGMINYPSDK